MDKTTDGALLYVGCSVIMPTWDSTVLFFFFRSEKAECSSLRISLTPPSSHSIRSPPVALSLSRSPAALCFWCNKINHNFRIGPLCAPVKLCCLLGCQTYWRFIIMSKCASYQWVPLFFSSAQFIQRLSPNFYRMLFIHFLLAFAFKVSGQNKTNSMAGVFWRDSVWGGRSWTQKYQLRYNSITVSIQREEKGETLPRVPLFLDYPSAPTTSSLL